MKISVGEDRTILLQEIFCNTVLETAEGNRLAICMRDDTIEMNVVGHHPCWYRVNMQTGKISPMDESAKTDTQQTKGSICPACNGERAVYSLDDEVYKICPHCKGEGKL